MFADKIVAVLVEAAQRNSIEPAALLALVEVETSGNPFESDGRTPCLLYERHIAWREASRVSDRLRSAFASAGLAIPHWSKATQYRDQRTSAQRLALIRRARAINDEVALRSASWGLGQTMGFLAEGLGFATAREMVDSMTGSVEGQIDGMIRELKRSHLVAPLNAHDWQHVARVYNGAGYAANQYDTKIGAAYVRWVRRLKTIDGRDTPPEQALSREEVEQIQTRLDELGYHEVGTADGRWGSRTAGAVAAFQAHEGLPVTSHYDDATRAAMVTASPREVSQERAEATVDDLAGSRTIDNATQLSTAGNTTTTIGVAGGASVVAEKLGWLDTVKEHLGDFRVITDALGGAGTWLLDHWYVVAVGLGLFIWWRSRNIVAARLDDHQTGRHAGGEA